MELLQVEKPCLVNIHNRGRNKENGDIEPIRRLADNTVIGVEDYGNQNDSEKNTAELHTPKVLAILEEKALYDSENKHRYKQ